MMNPNNIWYKKHWLAYVLYPLSLVYRLIVTIRRALFKCGVKSVKQFDVPVIVVGNISVGGVGKTPLTMWLVNWLQQQGYQPGVVSRGYGGQSKEWPQLVTADTDPALVGDEPVMLARRLGCPIVVAPNRVQAIEQLLKHNQCNIIVSDDGLQHYAMARDVEIVVVDAGRQFGNGWCLPAGPLREPKARMNTVDAIVYHVAQQTIEESELQFNLQPERYINLKEQTMSLALDQLSGVKVHAVAGIGHPERFFTQLQQLGADIIPHVFPDHYQFQMSDFEFGDDLSIVMTEKDAVKCLSFAKSNYYFLSVNAKPSEAFVAFLQELCSQQL